jgi:hypothetical protein
MSGAGEGVLFGGPNCSLRAPRVSGESGKCKSNVKDKIKGVIELNGKKSYIHT